MSTPYRFEGFAIISRDGSIAADNKVMPPALLIEADKKYYERELERMDAVVHGRNSHEGQPHSGQRKRLVVTRRVETTAEDQRYPNSLLWNPAGANYSQALGALGVKGGTIGILGGTEVFDLFLAIGFDVFHLVRAGALDLPGGPPVFSEVRAGKTPDELLTRGGLRPGPVQTLDAGNSLTVVNWTRGSAT